MPRDDERHARLHGHQHCDTWRVLRLMLLAPDIVGAILAGRQPKGMTVPGLALAVVASATKAFHAWQQASQVAS